MKVIFSFIAPFCLLTSCVKFDNQKEAAEAHRKDIDSIFIYLNSFITRNDLQPNKSTQQAIANNRILRNLINDTSFISFYFNGLISNSLNDGFIYIYRNPKYDFKRFNQFTTLKLTYDKEYVRPCLKWYKYTSRVRIYKCLDDDLYHKHNFTEIRIFVENEIVLELNYFNN